MYLYICYRVIKGPGNPVKGKRNWRPKGLMAGRPVALISVIDGGEDFFVSCFVSDPQIRV